MICTMYTHRNDSNSCQPFSKKKTKFFFKFFFLFLTIYRHLIFTYSSYLLLPSTVFQLLWMVWTRGNDLSAFLASKFYFSFSFLLFVYSVCKTLCMVLLFFSFSVFFFCYLNVTTLSIQLHLLLLTSLHFKISSSTLFFFHSIFISRFLFVISCVKGVSISYISLFVSVVAMWQHFFLVQLFDFIFPVCVCVTRRTRLIVSLHSFSDYSNRNVIVKR